MFIDIYYNYPHQLKQACIYLQTNGKTLQTRKFYYNSISIYFKVPNLPEIFTPMRVKEYSLLKFVNNKLTEIDQQLVDTNIHINNISMKNLLVIEASYMYCPINKRGRICNITDLKFILELEGMQYVFTGKYTSQDWSDGQKFHEISCSNNELYLSRNDYTYPYFNKVISPYTSIYFHNANGYAISNIVINTVFFDYSNVFPDLDSYRIKNAWVFYHDNNYSQIKTISMLLHYIMGQKSLVNI